ncbi:uncharacterized protein J7T54_005413 [Emericellopsis cladophorae]|uniref:Uncharacterized protein n=1 Tax=Emericellopsis cladophorae TaxID=2686198 RepID=A0A9P9XYL7_9HYPO|nr:uncharacterized protein J7T54_005413 [Emericellopsis cladophorae]KAI6780311.1 hypothetical protein J7T54_005413 [Emericellopsis cladophorae]
MSTFGRQSSDSAPVLSMPPQPLLQNPFGGAVFTPSYPAPESHYTSGFPPAAPTARKRSRDEAAVNLEPDAPSAPLEEESEEGWTLGPGMTLIKPNKGYVADAASQSGTWLEERKAADEEARLKFERDQLAARSKKLQRVDTSDPTLLPLTPAASDITSSPPKAAPVVDDFTVHLGIGWRKISDDEHIQAAARGWARFIEKHYPVSNAQIRLESKGLESYLVECNEGFFLFAEDLRQGRLVSTNIEGAFRNLQSSPPVFDGADTLKAVESPPPMTSQAELQLEAQMHLD